MVGLPANTTWEKDGHKLMHDHLEILVDSLEIRRSPAIADGRRNRQLGKARVAIGHAGNTEPSMALLSVPLPTFCRPKSSVSQLHFFKYSTKTKFDII
jgi:hypothetical protein